MRDPSRINRICRIIEEAWNKVPDWRFTQLISNLMTNNDVIPFYMEDDKTEEILKNFIENN